MGGGTSSKNRLESQLIYIYIYIYIYISFFFLNQNLSKRPVALKYSKFQKQQEIQDILWYTSLNLMSDTKRQSFRVKRKILILLSQQCIKFGANVNVMGWFKKANILAEIVRIKKISDQYKIENVQQS